MESWKVGDIAICVDNSDMGIQNTIVAPLKIGAEYIVQGVHSCKCGAVLLDIGFVTHKLQCGCGRIIHNGGDWLLYASRFRKKDLRSKEERIEEAVKEENYELAHLIMQE